MSFRTLGRMRIAYTFWHIYMKTSLYILYESPRLFVPTKSKLFPLNFYMKKRLLPLRTMTNMIHFHWPPDYTVQRKVKTFYGWKMPPSIPTQVPHHNQNMILACTSRTHTHKIYYVHPGFGSSTQHKQWFRNINNSAYLHMHYDCPTYNKYAVCAHIKL